MSVWWNRSILPLVCGRYGLVHFGTIPTSLQVSAHNADLYAGPLSLMTRSTVIPRAPNQATARRSTPLAVTARSSSWISAYATRE